MGLEAKGIHAAINSSISKIDTGCQSDMFNNIVLSGGSTLFPGFAERLECELQLLTPKKVNVIATNERKYAAWIGGSIYGSLIEFQQRWITQSEYEEVGSIVYRKCV
jgi:actin